MADGQTKLGIACVYFYGDDGDWLLDLQLRYIARNTSGCDYTIYAGTAKLRDHLKRRLANENRVHVVDLPDFFGTPNQEHAYYLNLLVRKAFDDGCTHIATLDADSFPICKDWPRRIIDELEGVGRFAAVHRTENLDTFLPHPCGCFMSRSFIREHDPDFLPSAKNQSTSEFREFLASTGQRADTGIGYAFRLWKSGEPWLRLERSNKKDSHHIMAGIYGGVLFHLGASSRAPMFSADSRSFPMLKFARRFEGVPLLWRIGFLIEERYRRKTARIAAKIRDQLRTEPEVFLAELAGEDLLGSKAGSQQGSLAGSPGGE